MTNSMTQHSASDLLSMLSAQNLIHENDADIEGIFLAQQQDKKLPLYVRALVGVGALIASLFFFGFAALSIIMSEGIGFVV